MGERILRTLPLRGKNDATVDEAIERLKGFPFEPIDGFASIAHHRALRVGMPEVVFAEGKGAARGRGATWTTVRDSR